MTYRERTMQLSLVGTYGSQSEANLVKAKLAAYGIECVVSSDIGTSGFPGLEKTEGVRVEVRKEDFEAALEVLERMLPPGD